MKKMIIGLTIGMLIGSSAVAVAATSPKVQATLVKYNIMVDGQKKNTSSKQLSYNGTTYIPLREAGSLFGYQASFDGPNKTIRFETKDRLITLGEFSEISTISVEQDKENGNIYHFKKDRNILLSVNPSEIKENEKKGVSAPNGAVVYFHKIKGSVLVSTDSLKAANLL